MGNEDLINAFYGDILNQVLAAETEKKAAAEKILIIRTDHDRWPYIREFLTCDLNKHRLLEQAAVAAMQNKSDRILQHIRRLYEECDEDEAIDIIRNEIEHDQKMLEAVAKEIKYPRLTNFFERRFLQEIRKYVVLQSREYIKAEL